MSSGRFIYIAKDDTVHEAMNHIRSRGENNGCNECSMKDKYCGNSTNPQDKSFDCATMEELLPGINTITWRRIG